MTLKLNPPAARALFDLFNEGVLIDHPRSLDERLVMMHMVSIYKKLRSKLEGEGRKIYNLNITMPEAIAYRIYWRDNDLSRFPYECNILTMHCMQIDRELLNTMRINHTNTNLLN